MDIFLSELETHERLLIQTVFMPFQLTTLTIEANRKEEEKLLVRTVRIGQVNFLVWGRSDEELDQQEKEVRELPEAAFDCEDLDEGFPDGSREETCILPTILNLRDHHRNYPVFGILVSAHDMLCEDCGTVFSVRCGEEEEGGEAGSAYKEKTPQELIASLPDDEQILLIDFARRFLRELEHQLRPSERMTLRTNDTAELMDALKELAWLPALARAFTSASFLWMAGHPEFFSEIFLYADAEKEIRKTYRCFEYDLVQQLPFDIRQEYAESASMLRGEEVGEFFAY